LSFCLVRAFLLSRWPVVYVYPSQRIQFHPGLFCSVLCWACCCLANGLQVATPNALYFKSKSICNCGHVWRCSNLRSPRYTIVSVPLHCFSATLVHGFLFFCFEKWSKFVLFLLAIDSHLVISLALMSEGKHPLKFPASSSFFPHSPHE